MSAIIVDSLSQYAVADDGGERIVAYGTFTPDEVIAVRAVSGSVIRSCYSGIVGRGNEIISSNGTSLYFIVPPMPVGPCDIEFIPDAAPSVIVPIIIRHRSFASNLYELRAAHAYPRYVGPRDISEEA